MTFLAATTILRHADRSYVRSLDLAVRAPDRVAAVAAIVAFIDSDPLLLEYHRRTDTFVADLTGIVLSPYDHDDSPFDFDLTAGVDWLGRPDYTTERL